MIWVSCWLLDKAPSAPRRALLLAYLRMPTVNVIHTGVSEGKSGNSSDLDVDYHVGPGGTGKSTGCEAAQRAAVAHSSGRHPVYRRRRFSDHSAARPAIYAGVLTEPGPIRDYRIRLCDCGGRFR